MNHLNLIITIYFDNILVEAHYWWENFISADNNLQTVSLFDHEKVKLLHEIYTVWNLLFHGYFLLSKLLAHKTLLLQLPVWLTTLCFFHNSNCFLNHQTLIVLIKQLCSFHYWNHFSLRVDWQKNVSSFIKQILDQIKLLNWYQNFSSGFSILDETFLQIIYPIFILPEGNYWFYFWYNCIVTPFGHSNICRILFLLHFNNTKLHCNQQISKNAWNSISFSTQSWFGTFMFLVILKIDSPWKVNTFHLILKLACVIESKVNQKLSSWKEHLEKYVALNGGDVEKLTYKFLLIFYALKLVLSDRRPEISLNSHSNQMFNFFCFWQFHYLWIFFLLQNYFLSLQCTKCLPKVFVLIQMKAFKVLHNRTFPFLIFKKKKKSESFIQDLSSTTQINSNPNLVDKPFSAVSGGFIFCLLMQFVLIPARMHIIHQMSSF